jgi:terminase, large subunit
MFAYSREAIAHRLARGLETFGVPEPMSLDEWARKHFYLSAESSYVEQAWQPWPFQRAILACISNDDIRAVDFIKSARVGYTKMILAAIGYFAHHKRRNQALWQPTDDDRDEFVKTELDPMLRDVAAMREVFPAYMARHKDNTLQQKKFLGSMVHLRGGKAAKNYRRISVDTAYIDEIDAFDNDVEKEGSPDTLAGKRIEGATFPKMITGSTPKLKGFSLIEARVESADARYHYHIPCPHCEGHHALTWGGKDEPHGFKWQGNDVESVRHLCPHCGVLITQAEYLAIWEEGFWQGDDGSTIDHDGVFRNAAGDQILAHRHIALHVWTAYSPAALWQDIVRDFIVAYRKAQEGDNSKLKAFVNTTRGETWEGDIERTDAEELKHRAEPFPLRVVPWGCLLLLVGGDTQDNRVELTVWGFGRGSEMWTIEHKIIFGNTAEDAVWEEVRQYLVETRFPHASGTELRITASAIDSGGHRSPNVYEFARVNARHNVFAVRGRPSGEKHIRDGAGQVDIDWRGKRRKNGVTLWHVGTNLAKDLIHGRLSVEKNGPGFIHFSNELSDEWFRQFAGEVRATRTTQSGQQTRWVGTRKRLEAKDCATYAIWMEAHLELGRRSNAWWDALEERVQPQNRSLFEMDALPLASTTKNATESPADAGLSHGGPEAAAVVSPQASRAPLAPKAVARHPVRSGYLTRR